MRLTSAVVGPTSPRPAFTRATSAPGETNDDFTTAAEVRRLGAQ